MRYEVYVVELSAEAFDAPGVARRNPRARKGAACFYVGSTAHEAACRFAQHVGFAEGRSTFACTCFGKGVVRRFGRGEGGTRGNRVAGAYGRRLRPDLVRGLNPLLDRARAEAAERALAERLRAEGAAVLQG